MSVPVEIKPSATLILLRQGQKEIETVLLQRHEAMTFGSAWVFPGGKIDQEDYDRPIKGVFTDEEIGLDQLWARSEIAAAARAAIRETHEEAGVEISPESLVLMSCWTTPDFGQGARFRTWFFVAEIHDQPIQVDGQEMLDHRWLTLSESVQMENVRALAMLPPTYNTLLDISVFSSVEEAIHTLRRRPLCVYNPKLIAVEGGFISLYEGDIAYESENLLAEGPRHRMHGTQEGYRLERTVW